MRRRRYRPRSFRAPSLLALLLGAAIVAFYVLTTDEATAPTQVDPQPVTLTLPGGQQVASLPSARVTNVVDGDTIDVELNGASVRIRYFGVDTPERGDACYREARERNEALIGERVLLWENTRSADAFGRQLRYVFTADGTSVDATLVAEGYGRAWTQDGYFKDQIVTLENAAQQADRGCLWK